MAKSGNCALCKTWRPVLERDHIIPRSKGGTDEASNIQLLCSNCHRDKTSREHSEFLRGKPRSAETRAKMSANNAMRRASERAKVSAALMGHPVSRETRAKISAAHARRRAQRETSSSDDV